MPITTIKIHPAIGIARVGNSPSEFFVGPEIPSDHTIPPGGYKDAQCRVKRQAARFRLFAYDQNGALVKEITSADGPISWTVQLTNKKAATGRNSGVSATDITIDPGPRTINGANQNAKFDTGTFKLPSAGAVTVPLGEIRTDNNGRLIVLGGFGASASPTNQTLGGFLDSDGWYDDVSDGPVTATVRLGAQNFNAVGAWVVVAPPKFSPQTDNVISLYDTLYQWAVEKGWLAVPAPVSYTQHVYPILDRASKTRWVNQSADGHHAFAHPVVSAGDRLMVWNKLKDNGGDMPQLQGVSGSLGNLTPTQYAVLQAWKDGNFVNDWAGVPAPAGVVTPDGMDQAALDNCVGAAFYPGIEAGGHPEADAKFRDKTNFVEPFRLDQTRMSPGDVTARMALPWQGDFNACASNWWPVPRPNEVLPQAGGSYVAWNRGIGSNADMVARWHTLGFVLEQGTQYVEVGRCDTPSIVLLTTALHFSDVPQGPNGASRKLGLAVTFEVESTTAVVTLQFDTGPTFPRLQRVTAGPLAVGPTGANVGTLARLWITYETGAVGESVSDQVTVKHVESGVTWTIPITANTIARKTTAVALVLDHSGSMTDDRGDGLSKVQSLRDAAMVLLDKTLPGDGVGIVRFNQDAQRLQGVLPLGDPNDPYDANRQSTRNVILGPDLNPGGTTSIGDGIFEGRSALNDATGFDQKAMLVLTDGIENQPRWIADVAAQLDSRTYAVGLGTPQNISTAALQTISGNTGAYLLITGAITGDNYFLLQKYFLQIQAGVSNADVVLDPEGILLPGAPQAIPVRLTEEDMAVDVVLLTPYPQYVDFRFCSPTMKIITPATQATQPGVEYVQSRNMAFYRVLLPAELQEGRFDQAGTWQVLLQIGRPGGRPTLDATLAVGVSRQAVRGLPYSVVVHSYSNISLRALAQQTSYQPGAVVNLSAFVSGSGMPITSGVSVWAEVAGPSGNTFGVTLAPEADLSFGGHFGANVAGVYRIRVRAAGTSARGWPYSREQALTAAVWAGGDNPVTPGGRPDPLCELIGCLLRSGAISADLIARLARSGLDLRALLKCLESNCARQSSGDPERSAATTRAAPALAMDAETLRTLARLLGGAESG
jgi:hypothetical protein